MDFLDVWGLDSFSFFELTVENAAYGGFWFCNILFLVCAGLAVFKAIWGEC